MSILVQNTDIEIMKGVEELQIEILDLDKTSRTVSYLVKNTPICQYDQHSRARVGVKFENYQVSDKPSYVFYSHVYDKMLEDEEFSKKIANTLIRLEEERKTAYNPIEFNLMTRNCSYVVHQTFDSLKGQMARRLAFCEEEFIVGLHWLLRYKLIEEGVEEAEGWLPGCDFAKKCYYAQSDYLSNMFGVLFSGCGRWPDEASYATFNESCTTPALILEQLNKYLGRGTCGWTIKIPMSEHEQEQYEKEENDTQN